MLTSGIAELDALLGGGIEQGSSTLVMGPAGTGKSLLTVQFAISAAQRGEKAALFIFDEELGLLMDRTKLIGIDLQRISLGAMIIALGLLVDDAIIAVETMVVKLEQGWDKMRAGSFAYTSTAFPMLTGTLVTAG